MEKRSLTKFSFHKEKIINQSSCMRRLADAINCKDGRNNQKLLSNNGSEEAGQSKKPDISNDFDMNQDITGTEKQPKKSNRSMKKLHQSSGSQFLFDQLKKNHKKPSQASDKMDLNPKIPENQLSLWSDEMCADKQKLAATLNEICHQIYQDGNGENLQRDISPSNFNQLDEASRRRLELRAKAFIHQIYNSRIYKTGDDDGSYTKSKQFLDAAEILRLNMDVFLKFLRDPYTLFLKNIRNLQFLPGSNSRKKLSLESKSSESRSCFVGNHQALKGKVKTHESDTNRIVQRKLKYENLSSTHGLVTSQLSNKTLAFMSKLRVKNKEAEEDVTCDYSSVQSHQNLKNKNQTTKATTKLSFKDVKHTIKQAVGENKKKLTSSLNNKMARSSKPYSDDVDEGANAKRRENKSNEPQHALISKTLSKKMKSVFTGNHKKQQVDMSVETKQQLSERSKNARLDEVLPKKEFGSSSCSPNRHNNHVSKQKGFYYSNHNATTDRSLEISRVSNHPKKVEFKPSISDNTNPGTKEVGDMRSSTSDSKSCGTLEASSVVPPGNTKVLAMLYEPMRVDVTSNEQISAKIEAVKARAVNRLYRPFLESSSPLHIRKLQIADGIEDKDDNTSPISVLEPFSPDDVRSPTSIASEPATSSLKQSLFRFDRASLDTCMDRKDTLYLYVKNIIQFSGMNFHDLFVKRASLKRTMKSCPDDGIASLAIELKCDYKLLLDCIHEAIRGVYRRYSIRIQRRLQVLEQDRVVPLEEKFINEVVKQVEFHLLEETEQLPIDQLVGKDFAMCSSSWFDAVTDTEDILIKVAEGVLLDSIVDTILEVRI